MSVVTRAWFMQPCSSYFLDLKEGSSNVVVMVMPKIDHCLAVHMHSSAVMVFYYGVNKSTGMIGIERDMWGSFFISFHR